MEAVFRIWQVASSRQHSTSFAFRGAEVLRLQNRIYVSHPEFQCQTWLFTGNHSNSDALTRPTVVKENVCQNVSLACLGEGAFKGEFTTCDLQTLHEIAGAHEQHAPSVLDEREPDGGGQVAFAGAGRPEQQEIGALLEPAIACG